MKKLFFLIWLFSISSYGAVRNQWATTNYATVVTNIVKSLATNVVTQNAGTVTSVGISGPAGFTWASSPITGSGTLTATTLGVVLTNGESLPTTFASDLIINGTLYSGTLLVTNPPFLDLSSCSNFPGSNVIGSIKIAQLTNAIQTGLITAGSGVTFVTNGNGGVAIAATASSGWVKQLIGGEINSGTLASGNRQTVFIGTSGSAANLGATSFPMLFPGGYLTNFNVQIPLVQLISTTNVIFTVMTNTFGGVSMTASPLTCTVAGDGTVTHQFTNSGITSVLLNNTSGVGLQINASATLPSFVCEWTAEWWHQ